MEPHQIAERVESIVERLCRAARRSGRRPEAVRLVAGTKSVPVEVIQSAIAAGLRLFGENRLQEAIPKRRAIERPDVVWHWLGRLQRSKIKHIIGEFEMIHSVDSVEIADEIDQRARAAGIQQPVLVQVNIGQEPTKAGFVPSALTDAL